MAQLLKIKSKGLSSLEKSKTKKLKSSTLIEVLVATVIIIMVFTIASLTLNNIFKSSVKNNTHAVATRINQLSYLYAHGKIDAKHSEDFKNWNITFLSQIENNQSILLIEAIEKTTKKSVSKKLLN